MKNFIIMLITVLLTTCCYSNNKVEEIKAKIGNDEIKISFNESEDGKITLEYNEIKYTEIKVKIAGKYYDVEELYKDLIAFEKVKAVIINNIYNKNENSPEGSYFIYRLDKVIKNICKIMEIRVDHIFYKQQIITLFE